MIPVIDDFVQRFSLEDFVVVADAGLMNEKNVQLLEAAKRRTIHPDSVHNLGTGGHQAANDGGAGV